VIVWQRAIFFLQNFRALFIGNCFFMFKNYFKTALRNFVRHKSNSVINIAGLTVGFAAFFLILLVIQYEKSFDDFHPDKNNIYRVVRIGKDIVAREYRAGVPFPVTQTLRTEAHS